jgi:hypothetical protein
MLELCLSATVNEKLWNALPTRASLPWDEANYLAAPSEILNRSETRRRFQRVEMHGRAALTQGPRAFGVYTRDVSPLGISFYAPVQFFPREVVMINFAETDPLQIEIRRCRRHSEQCYTCGGVYTSGAMSPAQFNRFLENLNHG